jgi:hypothetical protein
MVTQAPLSSGPTCHYCLTEVFHLVQGVASFALLLVPFGCFDKPAEKHYCLICCERKTLFRLKKQAEKYGL